MKRGQEEEKEKGGMRGTWKAVTSRGKNEGSDRKEEERRGIKGRTEEKLREEQEVEELRGRREG